MSAVAPADELSLFAPDVVDFDADGRPFLVGGRCGDCGRSVFPLIGNCRDCGRPLARVKLGDRATLYSHTVVRTRPPLGLPRPYAVGYVDLDGSGLRVFMPLDPGAIERLAIGAELALAVGALGHDAAGKPCRRPYFTPAE